MTCRHFTGRALLVVGLCSTGCATLFSSDKQDLKVRAYPEDALILVDTAERGHGSVTVPLAREKGHTVEIRKDGFERRSVVIAQSINPWFFANILFGPFFWIGMLIDAGSGNINHLSPTELTVNLVPTAATTGSLASARAPSSSPQASSPSSSLSAFDNLAPAGPSIDPTVTRSGTAVGTSSPQGAEPMTSKPNTRANPSEAATTVAADARTSGERPRVGHTMVRNAQREWVWAVMEVATAGKATFERHVLSALTDQIRIYLAERGARVIDRSAQEAAMKELVEEEKKRSYSTCVDSSCQIPLGKALAASHILRSTVARFGKACTTNGELIDLKAEVTIAAGSARGECEEEALLLAAETLAEQLIAGSVRQ